MVAKHGEVLLDCDGKVVCSSHLQHIAHLFLKRMGFHPCECPPPRKASQMTPMATNVKFVLGRARFSEALSGSAGVN